MSKKKKKSIKQGAQNTSKSYQRKPNNQVGLKHNRGDDKILIWQY